MNLVLLHGFGEDHRIWQNQVDYLSAYYRVWTPDLPGTGAVSLPADTSMSGLAHQVYAQLQEQGIEEPVILGHSMGGYITLALVAAYPNYAKAWGLIHSTAFPDSEAKQEARRKSVELIKTYGGAAFLQQVIPNLYSEAFKRNHPDFIADMVARYQSLPEDSLIAYYEAMMKRPDRTAIWRNSRTPVLMIAGAEDQAVPLADALQLASMPELLYLTILQSTAHMGMWEAPDLMNKKIHAFVDFVASGQ